MNSGGSHNHWYHVVGVFCASYSHPGWHHLSSVPHGISVESKGFSRFHCMREFLSRKHVFKLPSTPTCCHPLRRKQSVSSIPAVSIAPSIIIHVQCSRLLKRFNMSCINHQTHHMPCLVRNSATSYFVSIRTNTTTTVGQQQQ